MCCAPASLGYTLEAVQEANTIHSKWENINFPQDGRLIMATEPRQLAMSGMSGEEIGRSDSKPSMAEVDQRLPAPCQRPSEDLLSRVKRKVNLFIFQIR